MYESYKDRVAFYVVYIQEAHPTDLWQLPSNVKDGVLFASACVRKLGINIPSLVDGIGNHTERDYTGWPDRLYLISRGGRVLYKSDAGPFGFSTKNLEQALRTIQ